MQIIAKSIRQRALAFPHRHNITKDVANGHRDLILGHSSIKPDSCLDSDVFSQKSTENVYSRIYTSQNNV